MERANGVRPSPKLVKTDPLWRLPLSGGDPERVLSRIRKSKGAASDNATPANACVDLTQRPTADLLEAFGTVEKCQRTLAEFFAAVDDFAVQGVNPREAFAAAPAMRERFRALTWSAAHLYQALAAADALHRHSAERVTGVALADLGEQIVTAIEVLEYAPGRRT